MKSAAKMIAMILCLSLMIGIFAGCSKEKSWDPQKDPKKHIDHYEKLTALYGTERMAALEKLGYTLEEANVVSGYIIGIPEQVEYAGVSFDIYLHFNNDARLSGITYEKSYSYPTEGDLAIQDALKIGKQMEQELGGPDETDIWNDWFEEKYDKEMDPDPPTYQSESELKKLIENDVGGSIAWWDVTGFACEENLAYKTELSDEAPKPGISLNFSPNVDTYGQEPYISITITF